MPRQASAKQKSKNSKGNFMALQLRRVVTGHDENGKARVAIDEIVSSDQSDNGQQNGKGRLCPDFHSV
jgi:hypothetical protein